MNTLDSGWLVKRIARVMDTPTSSRTVITEGFNEEKARGYLKEVENHLSGSDMRSAVSAHALSGRHVAVE